MAGDSDEPSDPPARVVLCEDLEPGELEALFARHGVAVRWVEESAPIPGSHWGEPEAGIAGGALWVRGDTPVHSALHEGGHLICMGGERRATAERDAGGDELEECAVCYLQIVLADELAGVGRARLMRDMDAWGYSFRLGSTAAWFERDAEDGKAWLVEHGLLEESDAPGGAVGPLSIASTGSDGTCGTDGA